MFAITLLCAVCLADPTVTTVEKAVPDAVAEPIRKELDGNTIVIRNGDVEQFRFWFRKSLPSSATAEQAKNGLTYRELPETVVVGIVQVVVPFIDYRKQEIAAGIYTMRLGFQPENGDHMGTAPHAEFLLLSPADADRSLDETDLKTVVGWSKKLTNGDHPGVMLLFPHRGDKAEPAIDSKDGGVKLLTVKRSVRANQADHVLGFGITFAGHSKTR